MIQIDGFKPSVRNFTCISNSREIQKCTLPAVAATVMGMMMMIGASFLLRCNEVKDGQTQRNSFTVGAEKNGKNGKKQSFLM